MEAKINSLIKDVLLKENGQFIIPIYQRPYTWSDIECERLLDDIIKAAKTKEEYFVGCVVYQEDSNSNDEDDTKLYLVDGQQRITTIMLIAKALNLIATNNLQLQNNNNIQTSVDSNNIDIDTYVLNKTNRILYLNNDVLNKVYRLKTSYYDEKAFVDILNIKSIKELKNDEFTYESKIIDNFKFIYSYFKRQIIDWEKNIKDEIYDGLLKLNVVKIKLDPLENAQEIFETINTLGIKLSAVDSIRNFLFLHNDHAQDLFETKWKVIQDELIGYENMEDFIMHYLVMQLQTTVNKKDLYNSWIDFAKEVKSEIPIGVNYKEYLINDLYEKAGVYTVFLYYSDKYNKNINNLMKELRELDQTTCYAFLIRVFLDHKNHVISDEELEKVVNFIVIYIVRRLVCEYPNNLFRPLMFSLYDRLFKKNPENKKKYYETIYESIVFSTKQDIMPSIEEFKNNLRTYNLYKNKKLCKYLLLRIQTGRFLNIQNDHIDPNECNVIHIIPETLTQSWMQELNASTLNIHEQDLQCASFINTIGNLSLVSKLKNEKNANDSFMSIKKVLLNDLSKFKTLNKMFEDLNHFDLTTLTNRTEYLVLLAADQYKLYKLETAKDYSEQNIE